jgi:nicotinate-nucleotide adenylyltransferase
MRRLFYGGSFNPVHHAHLICARAVAETQGFDRVVLVPSSLPPHKPNAIDIAPAQDRLAMCRLAAALQEDLFEVDDIEIARGGRSYTIDTVAALRQRGENPVHWLIGADMLAMLPQWHQAQRLLEEARLLVMARPGWAIDWAALPPEFAVLRQNVVESPLIDISATDLRQRVARGRSIEYLTPAPVAEHIRRRGLYLPGGTAR